MTRQTHGLTGSAHPTDDSNLDPHTVASALVSVTLLLLCAALCIGAIVYRHPPTVRVIVASGSDAPAIDALDRLSKKRQPADRERPMPAETAHQPLGPQGQFFTPL